MGIYKKKANMKRLILIALFLIIFLASCSKNNLPVTENKTEIPTASVTLSPESVTPTILETGKIIQLSMVSMEVGFALTEDNHVIKTMDGGLTWSEFYTIKAADIRTGIYPYIYSIDTNTLFIMARYDGTNNFLSTTDGGKTWSSTVIDSELSWVKDDTGGYEMNFIDADNGYIMIEATPGAGQMLKTLYKTTDAGKNWFMITGDEGGQDNIQGIIPVGIGGFPSGMVFSTPQKGWTICSCYADYGIRMYRTDDGGETWNMVSLPEIPQEYSKWDKSNLFLSATQPSFYGSDNKNGKMIIGFTTYEPEAKETEYIYSLSDEDTWQLEGKSNTIISNDKFIDDNNGIGLDTSGSICITEDGGLTWKKGDNQSAAVSPSPQFFQPT
jgi:BNR/Asp-box repeat.